MEILFALAFAVGALILVRQIFFTSSDEAESEAELRIRRAVETGQLGDDPLSTAKPEKKDEAKRSQMVDRLGRRISDSEYLRRDEEAQNFMQRLDLALVQAGIRNRFTPEQAIAFAVVIWTMGVALPILFAAFVGLPKLLLLVVVAFSAAYPPLKLRQMINDRQDDIRAEVPFFIHQLYMAISTGMATIDDAIVRVARTAEEDPYDSILAREFAQAHIENRVGNKPMDQALRDLARRTGVVSVENLCEALIQGIRTGSELQQVLLEYSKSAREMWRQDMRTFKNRKEPLVTMGLVITMFGAFIIFATPLFISLLRTMTEL